MPCPSATAASNFILASASPRRKYLLEQAGLCFDVVVGDFDEQAVALTRPELYVKTLAEGKAETVAGRHPDRWVLGADTIVVMGHAIMGKPDGIETARAMLTRLSGQTHRVLTAYTLVCRQRGRRFSETVATAVQFKQLTAEEIDWYVHTREPFDKAGAYAIQGLGTFLVKRIDGSYTNVVGLPVCEVVTLMLREGIVSLPR